MLKNRENLKTYEQRQHLKELLELNETINKVMILKDKLKDIWTYRSRAWAAKALDSWCALAQQLVFVEKRLILPVIDDQGPVYPGA